VVKNTASPLDNEPNKPYIHTTPIKEIKMKLTLNQLKARIVKRAQNESDPDQAAKLNLLAADIDGLIAKYPDVGRLDFGAPEPQPANPDVEGAPV
jgi:hypothetical protein